MSPTTVLWQCAGQGKRWQSHGGVPKQLAPVLPGSPGVPLLVHAICRAAECLPDARQVIITEDPDICAFVRQWRGGRAHVRQPGPRLGSDADKVWTSRPYWSGSGRTWLMMGDLWLSAEGARRIFAPRQASLEWYGRSRGSRMFSKPWREVWGLSFAHGRQTALAIWTRELHAHPAPDRSGLWGVIAASTSQDLRHRARTPNDWVEVDDWTEDFDTPGELRDWQRARFGFSCEDVVTLERGGD